MKAFLPLVFVMVAGVFALLLTGCAVGLPSFVRQGVVDTAVPLATRSEIPAIDARAPTDTETATFALG
ncbi:MAG: hypothetical protein JXA93_09535 [Anaerolineae bacterium]|nr:hypothetical protein [Anaerolineae bacterium]